MNLKSLNPKWALAFAGAAVVGVVGVVLVLTLMRGGDEQATAQPDSATPAATALGQGQTTPTPAGWMPPTSPSGPYATPFELPYRVIISGPDTAHPGDQVTYEIQYQCVLGAQVCDNTRLTLRLDWHKGGSLIDFSPPADAPSLSPSATGVTFHGVAGVDQATFRIADGFDGDFWLAISMTGTTKPYSWPEGTMDQVTTHIVAEPGKEPAAEGYRVILSGPETAHPGDQVTYDIQYQCVLETGDCGQLSLVFASYSSELHLVTSSPKAELIAPNKLSFTFPPGASGTAQVVVSVGIGDFMVNLYTGIPGNRYAEGSVVSMWTRVVAEPTP
jgi:hypothetical protein